ncbi:alkaline phosphatase family protein [Streptomyces sp. NPDC006703]|uniref:alkaline phosphatase family protein n=1 Tax=Streptomyces sp. NPDC006703 TaxID=3364759 RepID=UPI00368FC1B5
MKRSKKLLLSGVASLALLFGAVESVAHSLGIADAAHPATGVGSCTLKGYNPATTPPNAKDLPLGKRPMTYKPDDFNCSGAKFAAPGVEFAKFPQPKNFKITNKSVVQTVGGHQTVVGKPTAAVNPTAPYVPPFQHFVIIYRENHTFDDYLGDCATTIAAGCNGQAQSTNHMSSVPNLHQLAKTYSLSDSYSTGVQPPSGPNHWFLFSGQSSSSSQQQSYPSNGTQFDRFLQSDQGPTDEGTSACTTPSGTSSGTSPYSMIVNGDIYWMLNAGSGYWKNPADGKVEVLPPNRPGTTIPEELHTNEYTCNNQSIPDSTVSADYLNFVNQYGMPAYNYVELFNDHPGTYQDVAGNDTATNNIVSSIMSNPTYKNNTLIVVTEDDTQNGSNGPDHVSNTYRVPLLVIGNPAYVKQHYVSHVAYTTANVLAAMERTMENVHSGVIDPNNNLGSSTFPMTTADQAALGDPLEDFWVQGATPLSASAKGSPTTGNAPLTENFTGTATGGTPSYTYNWNFGDGSTSTSQNPSHTYSTAGTYTATLTVTDSASPANTATSTVTVTADPIAATPPGAPTGLTGTAGTGQVSLSWTPPASTGGENITSYKVYRGTSSGTESLLTSGGCSGLGAVTSCTDTGLTTGQTYYYRVTAVNGVGEGAQSNEASANPTGSTGCQAKQLLGNPGFENGSSNPAPWTASSGVINNSSSEPPHSGSWDAWLGGYGTTHTDTLSQTVTLPKGCTSQQLSFWLHMDTAETSTTTAYDTLKVQVLNSSGTVLGTLHTYSNLDHITGYAQHTFDLSPYAGQTVTLRFTGAEDYEYQTSFVLDDTAINVQ